MKFDDLLKGIDIDTKIADIGVVNLIYVPAKKDDETFAELFGEEPKVKESHILASVKTGRFNGWTAEGITEYAALKNLLQEISDRFASDLLDDLNNKYSDNDPGNLYP